MSSMKNSQACAPARTYNLVLTHNPTFQSDELKDLIDFIRKRKLSVYLSRVGGFGQAELRVGLGDFVTGENNITQFLKKHFSIA